MHVMIGSTRQLLWLDGLRAAFWCGPDWVQLHLIFRIVHCGMSTPGMIPRVVISKWRALESLREARLPMDEFGIRRIGIKLRCQRRDFDGFNVLLFINQAIALFNEKVDSRNPPPVSNAGSNRCTGNDDQEHSRTETQKTTMLLLPCHLDLHFILCQACIRRVTNPLLNSHRRFLCRCGQRHTARRTPDATSIRRRDVAVGRGSVR